ncbi:hypothetical protein DL93DRAFT_124383 [Clavulina sp. PMI_390]|nr:hypothetical protein DL93DRAFT_124383 [Clavulina sp. PMI_390]
MARKQNPFRSLSASSTSIRPRSNNNILPVELLGDIFLFVTASERAKVGINSTGDPLLQTLLHLSSVNSYWRDVAIGLPGLWTTIDISNDKRALPTALAILELHLERSCGSSLDIYITLLKRQSTEYQSTLWNLISPHLYRCRTLFINQALFELAEFTLINMQPLERLEVLHLHLPFSFNHSMSEKQKTALTRLASTAPSRSGAVPFGELRLTSLNPFWTLQWDIIRTLLTQIQTPVAVLHLCASDYGLIRGPSELTLPLLRTLVSGNWDFSNYLLLPNLKHLVSGGWSNASLHEIPRQCPTLERLTFTAVAVDYFRRHMPTTPIPTLKRIDLVNASIEIMAVALEYFASPPPFGRRNVFPNLETLWFYNCKLDSADRRNLLRAILSVLHARPTLYIVWDWFPLEWDIREVPVAYRERISEGLETFPKEWLI